MEKNHTTNPQLIAQRILRLKKHLKITFFDLATLFHSHTGRPVRPLTVQRWAKGEFAPRLVHQRTLDQLERTHGLENIDAGK